MRRRTALLQPDLDFGGDKLRPIIAVNKARRTPQSKQWLQYRKNSLTGEGHADRHRQPFAGELIQDTQQPQLAARDQSILLKVVAPYLIGTLCLAGNRASSPDFTLFWALRHLIAALLPDTLHTLTIDDLTVFPRQSMSAADAKAWILLSDLGQFCSKSGILIGASRIAQARAC